MTPELWASVVLFLGGVVGTACRALFSASQTTFSRKSCVDIVIGGVTGVLYPRFPLIPLIGMNLLEQAALVAIVSYVAASSLQNLITSRIPGVQETLDQPRLTSSPEDRVHLENRTVPITPKGDAP